MAVYRFSIEDWHPATVNQLLGCHWGKRTKIKRGDRELIAHYSRGLPKASSPRRVRLTIVLQKGQRAADSDAWWKSLLDGLKHCGMLVDDNRQYAILEQPEFYRGTRKSTIIELEDID
jgi:hypothetical protein